ncbi:DUF4261 domain-containing protein [Succinimonas sp.]|uniref:DUF4261 domain-containing protein n=1 Tax=Succinimonas sp. TaxID=1936151 RepID=UPI0038666924
MVLQQDLSQKESAGSGHFGVSLLFKENTPFPDRDTLLNILKKHLGDVTLMSSGENMAVFSADKYKVTIDGHELTPQLVLMKCAEIDKPLLDDIAATQLWNCEDAETILEECHYRIAATDMLSAVLDYREHAKMLTEYTEALTEAFPGCEALLFENSKKMHAREDIVNCDLPQDFRFIHYAVNVRFFRLEGSDDFIVDSLGMSMLGLPDAQYHFHGLNVSHVINHAYALLSYLFDNGSVIKPGDTFDGVAEDGEITSEVQWQLNYEESLIQPAREVLDVNTGVYAAGDR